MPLDLNCPNTPRIKSYLRCWAVIELTDGSRYAITDGPKSCFHNDGLPVLVAPTGRSGEFRLEIPDGVEIAMATRI